MRFLKGIGMAYLVAVVIYSLLYPVPTAEGRACGPHHHWVYISSYDLTCLDDNEDF